MSKKYLSLDEAARLLAMAPDELVRLRERGEIRGFADRGTWKFKQDDVESLARRRQADSNPEVPLFGVEPAASGAVEEEELSEQPTVIRRDRPVEPSEELVTADEGNAVSSDSDSDVRLVGGPDMELGFDSDSDVKLVGLDQAVTQGLGTDPEIPILAGDSDSDVKLVRPDSDSDIKLGGADSDSDVKLVGGAATGGETDFELAVAGDDLSATESDLSLKSGSDSDIRLGEADSGTGIGDVTLINDDAVAIDFEPDQSRNASVLDDESGIALGGDSSLLLGESGISLTGPNDSGIALDMSDDDEGITLALDDDSGISIESGDSGISLEAPDSGISLDAGESGISLDDVGAGTIPMMDIVADDDVSETQFEIPSLEEDSGYDMQAADDATGVMDIPTDDAVFDLDEDETADTGAFEEEDLDLEAGALEEEEDLNVFDADEGAFEESGVEGYAAAGAARVPLAEPEWGAMTFVGLSIASICLLLCGAVMIDLVKNTATAAQPNPVSGFVLEALGSLYKG